MPTTHRTRRAAAKAGAPPSAALREEVERMQSAARRGHGRQAPGEPAPSPEQLKPHQLATLLAGLPGWRAKRGNRALVRRFDLPGRRAAAAFAQFVVELVETGGYNAWIELRGSVAIVTLFSPRAGGVTLADLQLAAMLAELRA